MVPSSWETVLSGGGRRKVLQLGQARQEVVPTTVLLAVRNLEPSTPVTDEMEDIVSVANSS